MKKTIFLLCFSALTIIHLNAQWNELVKKTASDGAQFDNLGISVAIDGDYAVVGAHFDDDNGSNSGSAYIFKKNQGGTDNWGELVKLTASDGATDDNFGRRVSIFGDYSIIGAHGDDDNGSLSGSAYIFKKDLGGSDNWGELIKLTASDGATLDLFGYSLAIHGDYAVVGAQHANPGSSPFQGQVYVFKKDLGGIDNWGELKILTASDGTTNDFFGFSVHIHGDYIIVGTIEEGGNGQGAAYIFKKDQGGVDNWGEIKKITHPNPLADDSFGNSVAINGTYAIVGASGDDVSVINEGSAHVFKQTLGGSDNWGHLTMLTASDGFSNDFFGSSVGIHSDKVIVGAEGVSANRGAIYYFEKDQDGIDNWGETQKVLASDGTTDDRFGVSVGISSDYAISGAWRDHIGSSEDQGSAYIYKYQEPCSGMIQVTDGPFSQEVIFTNVSSFNTSSFAISGGSDRLLIASMTHRVTGISSVSYDGTPMNLAVSHNPAGPSSYIYYLVLPGSSPINGSFTINSAGSNFTYFVIGAIVVSCADTSSPLGNTTTQSPVGNSSSLSISSSVNNLVVDAIAADANVTSWSIGANQSPIHTATANNHAHASSYEISSTGSTPMTWTWTGGAAPYTHSAAEFIASPPLPVEWINFDATFDSRQVKLFWETAQEINNEGFEIEHSTNLQNWNIIGFEPGIGNSSIKQSYYFLHNNVENGIQYYRLKQIDFDGNFSFSKIIDVAININLETPSLQVFPNPTTEIFKIQLINPEEESFHIRLFDFQGKLLVHNFHEEGNSEFVFVQNKRLLKGIYWIQVHFPDKILSERIVVQ